MKFPIYRLYFSSADGSISLPAVSFAAGNEEHVPFSEIDAPEGSRLESVPREGDGGVIDVVVDPLLALNLVLPDDESLTAADAFERFGDRAAWEAHKREAHEVMESVDPDIISWKDMAAKVAEARELIGDFDRLAVEALKTSDPDEARMHLLLLKLQDPGSLTVADKIFLDDDD